MTIRLADGLLQEFEADAIVVNLFQGVTEPGGATGAVDAALGGQIAAVVAAGDFKGKPGEMLVLYSRGAIKAPRVLVVGLGPADSFGLDVARRAAASAALTARKLGVGHLATIVHGAGVGGLDPAAAAQATVEGMALALYEFDAYKTGPDREGNGSKVATLTVVESDPGRLAAVESGVQAGKALAAGVSLARDLANHPANIATPTYLAEQAVALGARHGMAVETWDRDRMAREGMGALLSVAAGSAQPPQLIIVDHAPPGTEGMPPLVLAGKAVTFDSGALASSRACAWGP